MIENVVLDMGNVLLDYNPDVTLDLFFQTKEDKELIRQELFEGEEWFQADMGEITDEEMFTSISRRIPQRLQEGLKLCIDGWHVCMKPLPGAAAFCDYIRDKGYGIYVLSNASASFYQYFPEFRPLEYFDGYLVSSDVHMVKPDAGIYQCFLNKYQLEAKSCLFIDDRADNVKGAENAGMYAERFTGSYDAIAAKYHL